MERLKTARSEHIWASSAAGVGGLIRIIQSPLTRLD